jgi:hypothetical protein
MDKVVDLLAVLADSGVRLSVEGDQLNCYAPKGALTQDQKAVILRHKIELMTLLKMRQCGVMPDSHSKKENLRIENVPLAVGAQALVVLQELNPDSSAYNIPLCLKVLGPLHLPFLDIDDTGGRESWCSDSAVGCSLQGQRTLHATRDGR